MFKAVFGCSSAVPLVEKITNLGLTDYSISPFPSNQKQDSFPFLNIIGTICAAKICGIVPNSLMFAYLTYFGVAQSANVQYNGSVLSRHVPAIVSWESGTPIDDYFTMLTECHSTNGCCEGADNADLQRQVRP